jgi:hypothetical protein
MNVKQYRQQVEADLASATLAANSTALGGPTAATPEQAWATATEQLADPGKAVETRRNALQILQGGTFQGDLFSAFHPGFLRALRIAATDDDGDLRHDALDALVNFKDEFARQVLTEGLQGTGKTLVPAAAALGLLARDDHGSANAIARELLGTTTDIPTRAQAVRVLGADPAATGLLDGIMRDKNEFEEVRRAGAVALRSLDPSRFENSALEIVQDASDFGEIKASVSGALERAGIPLDRPPSVPGLK